MVYSASYTDEWGEPDSYKRYGKLIRGLQTTLVTINPGQE